MEADVTPPIMKPLQRDGKGLTKVMNLTIGLVASTCTCLA